jgi:hypothetical protein
VSSIPIFRRPSNVLYVSAEMREEICRRYGNLTAYLALTQGRELRRETRLPDDLYELELGPAVPVLAPRQRRVG